MGIEATSVTSVTRVKLLNGMEQGATFRVTVPKCPTKDANYVK
jgi:hypothetical protein